MPAPAEESEPAIVRTIGIMCAPYAGITRVRFDGYDLRLGRADRTTPELRFDHSAGPIDCKNAAHRYRAPSRRTTPRRGVLALCPSGLKSTQDATGRRVAQMLRTSHSGATPSP